MDTDHANQARVAFKRAVFMLGNQSKMAELLGITRQAVSHRMTGRIHMPVQSAEELRLIEEATGIKAHQLRPDLYPREEDTSPPRTPAQVPSAHPSAPAAQTPLPPAGVDGPLSAPDADPLEGMAA